MAIAYSSALPGQFIKTKAERVPRLVFVIIAAITTVALVQDVVEAHVHAFPFYLSEALLFKTTWLLFLPLLVVQWYCLKASGYTASSGKRILLIMVAVVLHACLVPLMIWSISSLLFDHTYHYSGTLQYTLSEDLVKLLVGYSLLPLLMRKTADAKPEPAPAPGALPVKHDNPLPERIIVFNGKVHLPLSVADIEYISAETPYIAFHAAGKTYLQTGTLKSIQQQLDGKPFLRVHKSAIVHLQHVRAYTSRSNGDYDLTLSSGAEVRLSRSFAAAFKQALAGATPVKL